MCRAHTALQELQAVALMLQKMAFCLSIKMVALHLDSSTAKAFLCNLTEYIHTHLSVEANYLLGLIGSQVAPTSSHSSGCIFLGGQPEVNLLA